MRLAFPIAFRAFQPRDLLIQKCLPPNYRAATLYSCFELGFSGVSSRRGDMQFSIPAANRGLCEAPRLFLLSETELEAHSVNAHYPSFFRCFFRSPPGVIPK